uniref:C-type lectin domain-containing protein n=1 Tax=Neogobius melanostomus TaxID=47308 RepID=A0A8C6TYK8_9GOBI
MASNCLLFLLLQAISAMFGKYVYVEKQKNWNDAQDHCRKKYTDLAPISNEYDFNLLFEQTNADRKHDSIWIGLMRDPANTEQWLWSGGCKVVRTFWREGQPDNHKNQEDKGQIYKDLTWNDIKGTATSTFFCYKVHVVREKKTWEEALDHCRRHHRDLASVASETELMLMKKELGTLTEAITEHVWIGLRFLAEDWLWVDGQPLEYEAWGLEGKPWCPMLQRCAALQVTVVNGTTDVTQWNARQCDDELHFLCY